jgi:drug/metabolite transporter (DMT)-like permease
VILLALSWRAGLLSTLQRRWRWLIIYAVAEIAIPFPLIAAGEVHVASSLAAILIASVPLIGAVLAVRFDHAERPTRTRAIGLGIGFAGVIALVGVDIAGRGSELLGAGAILIAAVGYSIGPMVVKHRLGGLTCRRVRRPRVPGRRSRRSACSARRWRSSYSRS